MSEKKQCPLCGKDVNGDDALCEDCQNHVDNQYATDFLETEDPSSLIDEDELELEIEQQIGNILDEPVPVVLPEEEPVATKKKKGLSKGVIFFLVGCLVLILVGALGSLKVIQDRKSVENEERFWMNCVEENTPVSYAKYLVAFQNGKYAEEADNRIREFRKAEADAWEKLKKSRDINDFYAYLSENPKTPHIRQIRFLMDSLSWISATKDDTKDAYKAYLENVNLGNLSGEHVDKAEERSKYLSEIVILEGAALDSLKLEIGKIAKGMSQIDTDELIKIFAPEVSYFGKDTINTKLAESIVKERKDKKIKTISFTPQQKTIKAQRDNLGISFVELSLNKETVYNIKIKKGKKTEDKKESATEKWRLELTKDYLIRKIE
ncbi:MAG: hypothetical protein E6772_15500 [Dysgonomonas sp.]|nr:hypothetical protein [Dysgonomonas sp.]